MRTYHCNKLVLAALILSIMPHPEAESRTLIATDDPTTTTPLDVSSEWVAKHKPEVGGYYVVYESGYASYSPKEAFEAGYRGNGALTYGMALDALKAGKRVARAGWNGKGMFLFLLPAADGIPTKVIHDPALRQVIETEVGGETFDAYGSIRMFTADKKILTGWLANQTDMLCEDWTVL
jgi:hypothetical protein